MVANVNAKHTDRKYKAEDLVAYKDRGLGVMVINRPQALNALKWEMIQVINKMLDEWADDDEVKAVLFYGAGEKSFCAGGDIKAVHQIGNDKAHEYFSDEYGMNAKLYHYKKPLIALMNGITMGGGYGVAGYCDFRVVTEYTKFAMPEVGIGFFPDIGSVYFMNQMPGQIGAYLSMTGATVSAEDTLYIGVGTHTMAFSDIEIFMEDVGRVLRDMSEDYLPADLIETTLKKYKNSKIAAKNSQLKKQQDEIDNCFQGDSVENILSDLENKGGDWGCEIIDTIRSKSPLSVKLALINLRFSEDEHIDSILARDLRLSDFFMAGNEFKEGVRALLIDKDKSPKWGAARIENVSDTAINDLLSGKIDIQAAVKILG